MVPLVIGNDNLVSESVKFDERMCSDTELKFGLCEGTQLEFQYFGIDNITGHRIKAEVDVQYDDGDGITWYTIPMGWFMVDSCSRQASTGIRKASCYNKLLSDYLDAKANEEMLDLFAHDTNVYLVDIIDNLLDGFGIYNYEQKEIMQLPTVNPSGVPRNGQAAFKYLYVSVS